MLIKDIFYSYQGEGPYVGYPQVFIRFFGCNIHCQYCDEPDLPEQKKKWNKKDVLTVLAPLLEKPIHSISITGGEPLLHTGAIIELAPDLHFPLYLETNGLLPEALEKVMPLFTYFSVDFKPGYEEKFEKFMQTLLPRIKVGALPSVFVKYVMKDYQELELLHLKKILKKINPFIPCIIQPVTPYGTIQKGPNPLELDQAYLFLSDTLKDLRVIGQTHKLIGVK